MLDLDVTDQPGRFRLVVTDDLCVGPAGHVFLFGGMAHAAAIAAMHRVVATPVICSTIQFLSFVRRDRILDIRVEVPVSGRRVTRATTVACEGDRVVFTAAAAFGTRSDQPTQTWFSAPPVRGPDACMEAAAMWPPQAGGFSRRLEVRRAARVDDRDDDRGRLSLWIRVVNDRSVDEGTLAVLGDFVPMALGRATGRPGGGNSLDNVLRVCGSAQTGWVLGDFQTAVVGRGAGHGSARLFAEDGTLLALANQSLILLDER